MISEGSCDTENWSNDVAIIKIIFHSITIFTDQINVAFFQKH